MLAVPRLRQPDAVTCLPACIWAVLRYHGNTVSYEEVAAACRLDALGAVAELAIQGLHEAGWDVEIVTELDITAVSDALAEDRPPVALFDTSRVGDHRFSHAVVICEVTDEHLTVMDPRVGDYVSVPLHQAEILLSRDCLGSLFIAGIRRSWSHPGTAR